MTDNGQLVNTTSQMGLAIIPENISHRTGGTDSFVLERPDGATMILLHIESDSFRMRAGDHTLVYATPAADVLDDGTWLLEELELYVFTAPKKLTIVPEKAGAILTFAWI